MNEIEEYTYTKIYDEMWRLRSEGVNADVFIAQGELTVIGKGWKVVAHCTGSGCDYWLVVRPL